MQSFKVFNHAVEVEFKGRLLAQSDTRKTPDQTSWSEFQIYATEGTAQMHSGTLGGRLGLDQSLDGSYGHVRLNTMRRGKIPSPGWD